MQALVKSGAGADATRAAMRGKIAGGLDERRALAEAAVGALGALCARPAPRDGELEIAQRLDGGAAPRSTAATAPCEARDEVLQLLKDGRRAGRGWTGLPTAARLESLLRAAIALRLTPVRVSEAVRPAREDPADMERNPRPPSLGDVA